MPCLRDCLKGLVPALVVDQRDPHILLFEEPDAPFQLFDAFHVLLKGLIDSLFEALVSEVLQPHDGFLRSTLVRGLCVCEGKLLGLDVTIKQSVALFSEFTEAFILFCHVFFQNHKPQLVFILSVL